MEMVLIVLVLILAFLILVIVLYKCYKLYRVFTFKTDSVDQKDMRRYKELYEDAFLNGYLDDPYRQGYDGNALTELSKNYVSRPKFTMIRKDHELCKERRFHQFLQIGLMVALTILLFRAHAYLTMQENISDWMIDSSIVVLFSLIAGLVYLLFKFSILDGWFINNIAMAVDSTAIILRHVRKYTHYFSIHRVYDYQVFERYILIHGYFTSPKTGAPLPELNYRGIRVARIFSKDDESQFLKRLDELKVPIKHEGN